MCPRIQNKFSSTVPRDCTKCKSIPISKCGLWLLWLLETGFLCIVLSVQGTDHWVELLVRLGAWEMNLSQTKTKPDFSTSNGEQRSTQVSYTWNGKHGTGSLVSRVYESKHGTVARVHDTAQVQRFKMFWTELLTRYWLTGLTGWLTGSLGSIRFQSFRSWKCMQRTEHEARNTKAKNSVVRSCADSNLTLTLMVHTGLASGLSFGTRHGSWFREELYRK